ncbi:MAG: ATP-binding protein, partial [bacterium]|nr:ATP-binding protein [Candidatus Limimorpha equi]
AQIDLLIDRKDNVINLCEMKFSDNEYAISKEEEANLRRRRTVFQAVTKTRKSIHNTLITTVGLKHNIYWGSIQSVVILDDLFR